jgi:hypothetical protein
MNMISMGRNLDEDTSSILNTLLDAKGNYTLLIFIKAQKQIAIGRIGTKHFQKGYYAYTGSAFGKGSKSWWTYQKTHQKTKDEKMAY